jgi:hypothetical protein
LENLLSSVSGLIILLSSQFHTQDFEPYVYYTGASAEGGWDVAIGGYFLVKFPNDWPAADGYEFDWEKLKNEADPFQSLMF